jgi:hypothetical protein
MAHQLIDQELHLIQDNHSFFLKYLGKELYEKIFTSMGFSLLSEDSISLIKLIAITFAFEVPHFDHVIRRDVGTQKATPSGITGKLLLYFGVQYPLAGATSQFLGLAYDIQEGALDLILYIAGATEGSNLSERINKTNNTRSINEKSFRTIAGFNELIPFIKGISNDYLQELLIVKGHCQGFTPSRCRSNLNRIESENWENQDLMASKLAFDYWREWSLDKLPEDLLKIKNFLNANNKQNWNKFVHLIFSGVPVAEAFKLVLDFS